MKEEIVEVIIGSHNNNLHKSPDVESDKDKDRDDIDDEDQDDDNDDYLCKTVKQY